MWQKVFPKVQNMDVCAPNNVFLSFDILNTQQQNNAEHQAGKYRIKNLSCPRVYGMDQGTKGTERD